MVKSYVEKIFFYVPVPFGDKVKGQNVVRVVR